MMSEGDIYFNVIYSERVEDSLRAAADRAEAVGQLGGVRDAIRLLRNWLRADPETLGEPYRIHKSKDITEYIGFVGPLTVHYNIHHESMTVYVVRPVRLARWAGF
jgi:hypothetical protein